MSMTYTSLVAQVMDYLDRTDQDTQNMVGNFIYLAQDRIVKEVNTIGFTDYFTGTFRDGVYIYPKPANWRRTISFNVGNSAVGSPLPGSHRNPLQLRTREYLMLYWPDRTLVGVPLYYDDKEFYNFYIAPTPQAQYPFEVAYYATPPTLNNTVQTNWLTNFAPRLLLYATLCEAMPFIKNDERLERWTQLYKDEVALMNGEDSSRKLDRGTNIEAD